jgi:single-strand DNA-binding protein
VLSFRLATTSSWLKDGERKEQTDWHSCQVWGKRAEALNKILQKGMRLYVEGRIQTRSWEDKNGGGKRYATEINVENVILCGGGVKDGGTSERRPAQHRETSAGDAGAGGDNWGGDDGDKIPF